MGRTAYELMEEGEFNAVKGKYFTKYNSIFYKPIERGDDNYGKFVVYNTAKIKNGLVEREEIVGLGLLFLEDRIEVPESLLPFDPITLRLRK